MKAFFLVLLYTLLLTNNVQAEIVGRIDSNNPNGFHCKRQVLLANECRAMRIKAKQRRCINHDEYRLLEKYNLCPVCDWYESGEDAYEGYCRVKNSIGLRRRAFGGRRFDFADRIQLR